MKQADVFQLIRYIAVGVINTLVYTALYQLGLLIGLDYRVSLTVSLAITIVVSYLLSKIFAFRKKGNYKKELPRFLTINVIQYVVLLASLFLLVEIAGLAENIAGLFLPLVSLAVSYAGHKFWTFR